MKSYQRAVLEDLEGYLEALERSEGLQAAWREHWARKGEVAEPYRNTLNLNNAPCVCIKVPTGGGKTFLAACALRKIFDWLPPGKTKLVLWLVPSEAILSQTLKNLGDPDHPYRRRLERDFGRHVNVLGKEEMLAGQSFGLDDVEENLTVGVFCYASVRVDPKKAEDRKIYQENPKLSDFEEGTRAEGALLEGTDATALIQAIRGLSPVVIVDESHNAGSKLSTDMLKNLNPSFVLSLTATPRAEENIVSRVDARALKRENMVKLPVIVYRPKDRKEVIRDAVQLRASLEAKAKAEKEAGGASIRPIALLLAEPRRGEETATFEKLREELLGWDIPPEQVAVKTAEKDDLKGVDLMAEGCPVRFVITVNALKEGWDCPFAYVLASVANKSSKTEVEQVLGRVLRQPYARNHSEEMLNWSYVFSCGEDFQATIENVVAGLNGAGFSSRDYRAEEAKEEPASGSREQQPDSSLFPPREPSPESREAIGTPDDATVSGKYGETADAVSEPEAEDGNRAVALEESAKAVARQYEEEIGTEDPDMGVRHINKEFEEEARALRVPQFLVRHKGLGEDEWCILKDSDLMHGFSLKTQDAAIDFGAALEDAVKVDLAEKGDAMPKCRMLTQWEQEVFAKQLAGASDEQWLDRMTQTVERLLDRKTNTCSKSEIQAYVRRGLEALPAATRQSLEPATVGPFAESVRRKIEGLKLAWRHKMFEQGLDTNEIRCLPEWKLPETIAPAPALAHVAKSLYEAEWSDMNDDEKAMTLRFAAMESVRWWHRIREKQGFGINGWRKHYPDFMVMTKSGTLVLVETKGGHLNGTDSIEKCELGRKWADLAGPQFKYFMVFKPGETGVPGAVDVNGFLSTLERL